MEARPRGGGIAARGARALALLLCAALAPSAFGLTYSNRFRSPRNSERRIRSATTLIVLHTTEAGARSSLNKLCERGECHFCVPENGTVYRIIDRERVAFHAGRSMWNGKEDCDEFSVGIEVVGHHDEPITLKQCDALRELVAELKQIYRLSDAQVVTHSQVAYGAPNKWQKRNHRGRKRCGMLFAMRSVRGKLGLEARVAVDPDVRAKRLVQADPYLAKVLYGNVDTMAGRIGNPVAAPQSGGLVAGIKSLFGGEAKQGKDAAKSASAEAGGAAKPASKPAPAPAAGAKPFVKSALKGGSPKPPAAKPGAAGPAAKPSPAPGGKTFVKAPLKGGSGGPPPAASSAKPAPPPGPPTTLAQLNALSTHRLAGVVDAHHSASRLAGRAWNRPETYYFTRGKVVTGDKVNPARLEKGAVIYVRK